MKARTYLVLEPGRRVLIWREALRKRRPWWERLLARLDRIFWP